MRVNNQQFNKNIKPKHIVSFGTNRSIKYIKTFPNSAVSTEFVKNIATGLDSLGPVGSKIIKGQKLIYNLAQKTSDIRPDLKGVIPRGWPSNKNYDNCAAFCTNGTIINLFEKPIDEAPASAYAAKHETGHALDHMFEKIISSQFTSTQGFEKVYLKDIGNFESNYQKYGEKMYYKDQFDYYIQGSTPKQATNAGKAEIFADTFAILQNTNSDREDEIYDKTLLKLFPSVTAYVEKLLYLLGRR